MVAIDAVEIQTARALLADGLTSDDAKPLEIILAKFWLVLVRACTIAGLVVAATTSDVVLIAELLLLELVDLVVVVIHVHVNALAGLVLADDWSGDLRFWQGGASQVLELERC